GQHLCGVPLVGEPVPHRYSGPLSQRLDVLMGEATKLDAVVHATEHARCVFDCLLLTQLRLTWTEIADMGSLVMSGHLERRARARRGLLKDQCDIAAFEGVMLLVGEFLVPQLLR